MAARFGLKDFGLRVFWVVGTGVQGVGLSLTSGLSTNMEKEAAAHVHLEFYDLK